MIGASMPHSGTAPATLPPSDQMFMDQLAPALPMLRNFARRLCGQQAMAEDLTQEAVMRGWAARRNLAPNSDLRAWLFVILRNCFYTTLRRERRTAGWDPELAEHTLITPPHQDHTTMVNDVAKAMDRLPAAQRHALMLVGVEGLSYEEAARRCDCALGTMKSRLARGRRALALAVDGPDDDVLFARRARSEGSVQSRQTAQAACPL
ncbi:sigma-70 family RNA polymerase sigma factor [Novosphingobium sp. KACC 22771]|uniref:sigma-70 family RNA polymerase sigma factor n=1 Tax=Novosphingobium sp. KACC 22771 TaxID=3025670 RepID=UPI0023662C6F|nr:sigma-70 family RNA polymerase sigma factor [Novosphingobium sp. KACC 22771]WDF72509.1 sigma-70 family RNA polymerase sigma factor [Novosphingobium sp. KACC 22771]